MWGEGSLPREKDQNMAKKEKPSTQDEQNRVESGGTTSQPTPSLTKELLELKLSEGQCRTILKYAELPAHLSERLAANRTVAKRTQLWAFTGVVAVALPKPSRASTDTSGRPLVFQATVPGLCPLRAA